MAAFLRAVRTFALRFFIALIASFLVLNAALYAADHAVATKIDQATKLEFRQGSLHDTGPSDSTAEPANFLIVGSDTRGFVHSAVDVSHFGSASADPGARSDTVMIAHIDPNIKQATIVSFPRDLTVTLPGGCRQKINAAYNQDFRCNSHSPYGGPQQIVDTLHNDFNISINHYVEVNFPGFRQMVDVLGSVPIYFPASAKDKFTGLTVDGGCQNLTGIMALNYVRSRHYQYFNYATGRYVAESESDLARIRRQQYFIRTLMQTAIDQGARNPLKAFDFAGKMARSLAIDRNFSESDLKRLIRTFRLTDPGAVQMLTVPTVQGNDGGLDLASDADTVLQKLRTFAPPPPAPPKLAFTPAQVNVEVVNASGIGASPSTTAPGATSTTSPTTGPTSTTSTSTPATTATAPTGDWVSNRAETLLQHIGFPVAIGPAAPESNQTVLEFTSKTAGKAFTVLAHMSRQPKLSLVPSLASGADVVLRIGRPGSLLVDPDAPVTTTTTTTVPTTNGGGPTTTTTIALPNPGTPPSGTPASSVKSQWIGCR